MRTHQFFQERARAIGLVLLRWCVCRLAASRLTLCVKRRHQRVLLRGDCKRSVLAVADAEGQRLAAAMQLPDCLTAPANHHLMG